MCLRVCVYVCVHVRVCVRVCGVYVYGFFVIEVPPSFSYCLLQAVKIHIEDHSVSSRVILCMDGWMQGWMMEWVGARKRP